MTAKEYLSRARKLQSRLDALERARAGAWERATATTANGSTPVSGGDISRKTEAYAELVATIDREYDRLGELKQEIIGTISKVQDNTLAALLIAYYVDGATWDQTAEIIHYSIYRTVHDKHPQALRAVEGIINATGV